MHYLMLVTLTTTFDQSLAVREKVYSTLINDDSFCGSAGRFGSPLCDWFVLGGRWSGTLAEARLGQTYREALLAAFADIVEGWYPERLTQKYPDRLNDIWREVGGTEISPLNRKGYDELGDEDDAMRIDRFLYDKFLREFDGKVCDWPRNDRCSFCDLDDEPVDEAYIGRKWLVVVDYHN